MGRLTTHVLDTSRGAPGAGIRIELYRVEGGDRQRLAGAETNADGRTPDALLEGEAFTPGIYELWFHAGAYFEAGGVNLPSPKFLDVVVIRFGIAAAGEHYHVPLLLTPWSYATYRGS